MATKAKDSVTETLPLIKVDTALTSLRASHFDTPSAVGELVDNALEAKANTIKIRLIEGERRVGKKQKHTPVVEQIAVADDGTGMSLEVLYQCLQLGYSTRYNSRTGLGRFGVGGTLAGISQAKRIEMFSRVNPEGLWLHSYIDLDEIVEGRQQYMPEPQPAPIPKEFNDMMPSGTGTLVIWSKCDRLVQGEDGTVNDLKTVREELVHWLSRAYRHFLDGGVRIELDNTIIEPHDPLYLMTIPRFVGDPKAEVLLDEPLDWPVPTDPARTSPVRICVTLLPEEWRLKRGWGDARHTPTRERRIHENEGLSILRAKREIFFGILPRFYPSAVEEIDRWIGIEISFEPDLDECFRVRNVKKGAEPVEALRDALRNKLKDVIKTARRRVKHTYTEQENKEKAEQRIHQQAEEISAEVEKISPKARAGTHVPPEDREAKIEQLALQAAQAAQEEGTATPPTSPGEVKKRIEQLPFSIIDLQWPGKEFIEIEHLGSNTIVKLNNRHPFFTKIYSPVLKAAGVLGRTSGEGQDQEKLSEEELQRLARIVQVGLDLLIVAYAKSESMDPDPERRYGDLRTHWGMFLYNMIERLQV
ncbi:MAG TPA: ATP-binding protein [Candidatus Xenobia bacterium]|nr:ATP-binding protein [Candidatus Xenobia bacterium]